MDQEELNQVLRDAFEAESSGNLVEAIRFFKRAARNGSNDARSKLGTIYDDTTEVTNPSRAI